MNDNFKKKAWISFGVLFLSIAGASGALYYLSNDLAAQAARVIIDKGTVAQQQNALGNLALLKAAQPQADVYSAAIQQLVPDQYGVVSFGGWLTKIAQKYNVTAKSTFKGNPSVASPAMPGTYGFTLDAQGSVTNLEQFLKDIESQSVGFPIKVTSFDLSNAPSSDNSGGRLSLQGMVFFR